MHPCGSSPWSRPRWTPLVWIACMVFICSGSQALVPNVQKTSSVWTTLVPGGVQSTSLTPEDVRAEGLTKPCGNKTSTCADFCSLCDDFNLSRPDCYKITIVLCDGNFTNEMAALNSSNWCMWDKVKSPYNEFTECTETLAECLLLPWPNRVVEDKFVTIHSLYFQNCPTETLRDPPPNVILALVMTPICLIPAMVVLVVMKTKNGDRRS